jgi:secondary thiamine-phosphate synthase enzyme
MVINKYINLQTKGNCDIINITSEISNLVKKENTIDGCVTVFVKGSTAAVTTIEYEPGLIKDIKDFFDRIIPSNADYSHDKTWHDGNGHSHLRASIIGPSLTIPFANKELFLGTWQQVIFIDFDTRARSRKIILQIKD